MNAFLKHVKQTNKHLNTLNNIKTTHVNNKQQNTLKHIKHI